MEPGRSLAPLRVPAESRTRALSPLGRLRVVPLLEYLGLAVGAVLFLLPAAWLLSSSLQPAANALDFPPDLIPAELSWSNYPRALTAQPFHLYLRNTLVIVILNL